MVMMFKRSKKTPHVKQVLEQLKKSGKYGSYNYELARIGGLAWHRRITDLRKQGLKIEMMKLSNGKVKYFLREEQ